MNRLEQKLNNFIKINHLIAPGQSVLLAVSGGIDSMVMLHVFRQLSKSVDMRIKVVHINHKLRGEESDLDERFVIEKCRMMRVPVFNKSVNVETYAHDYKLSKQAAARYLRYESIEKIRRQTKSNLTATAHHADDNAETVLLNILRGTGIHGLAGIPLKRKEGSIIRPLLFATRKEIESYAKENGIEYRNDSSNDSNKYRRNLIRHLIMPALMDRYPEIVGNLNTIAGLMRDVSDKIRKMADDALLTLTGKDQQECLVLDIEKLEKMPEFLWNEIFMEILRQIRIEPTEKKVEALYKLCKMPTGRFIELGMNNSVYRDRRNIVFVQSKDEIGSIRRVELGRKYEYRGYQFSISNPQTVPERFANTNGVEYIDAGRLGSNLILRPWHPGDWFIPFGMKAKKKLSDFFTDQKVPRFKKTSIPVLESDGTIVWICGKRLDNRFRLTEHTQKAVRLSYEQLS